MKRVNIQFFSSWFLALRIICSIIFSKRFLLVGMLTVLLTVVCMFIPTTRNLFLYRVWPNVWRDMPTLDALSIKFSPKEEKEIEIEECYKKTRTDVSISDVDVTKVMFYPHAHTTELRDPGHRLFFPVLTKEEKVAMLHLYLIVARTLQRAGILFFLVEGSLLGVHRHQGLIPWDDDIDIAISAVHRKSVHTLLSCIEGYNVKVSAVGHWKFYPNSTRHGHHFPFIDIFFYSENDKYVWALADYLQQTVIFYKDHTFPLRTAKFDGLDVPVPKDLDYSVRTIFDVETCQSPSYNHKAGARIADSDMLVVKCSSLTYLYAMFNLKH